MKAITSLALFATLGVASLSAAAGASRITQLQGTTGYPANVHWVRSVVTGPPGTVFETFISRPGGGALLPFGASGTIPPGGVFVAAFGYGRTQPPVTKVEVWSVSTAPVRAKLEIQ